MWWLGVWTLFAVATAQKGYPLYFASFEEVGKSHIALGQTALADADGEITDWLEPCDADAFVLIRDSTPYDSFGLRKLKALSTQSETRGSFLTDYVLNMDELSLDLEAHCNAHRQVVDIHSDKPVEEYQDQQPRIFYVAFDHSDTSDKNEVLSRVFSKVPSPYVTVIYTNTHTLERPLFEHVEKDPRRKNWAPHRKTRVAPIIAPLVPRTTHLTEPATAAGFDIPDNVVVTTVLASTVMVVLLLLKNALT